MQTIKIFRFPIKIWPLIVLDPGSSFITEWHNVYSRPITLFKGVDNPIKLWNLNTDQKPINISNISLTCNLFTPGTQYQWISKSVTNVDSANGVAQVTFVSSDLAGLELGKYEIGMTATDINFGNATPVYLNDNYQGRLTVNLELGSVSALTDPIPVTFTDTPRVGVVSNYIDLTVRPSGNNNLTFGANLIVPYTGNIVAQGAMITNPVNGDFGNILLENYDNFSGLTMFNVPGTYATIRFLIDELDPNGTYGNINANNYITSAAIRY